MVGCGVEYNTPAAHLRPKLLPVAPPLGSQHRRLPLDELVFEILGPNDVGRRLLRAVLINHDRVPLLLTDRQVPARRLAMEHQFGAGVVGIGRPVFRGDQGDRLGVAEVGPQFELAGGSFGNGRRWEQVFGGRNPNQPGRNCPRDRIGANLLPLVWFVGKLLLEAKRHPLARRPGNLRGNDAYVGRVDGGDDLDSGRGGAGKIWEIARVQFEGLVGGADPDQCRRIPSDGLGLGDCIAHPRSRQLHLVHHFPVLSGDQPQLQFGTLVDAEDDVVGFEDQIDVGGIVDGQFQAGRFLRRHVLTRYRHLARRHRPECPRLLVDIEYIGRGAVELGQLGDQFEVAAGAGSREGDSSRLANQAQRAVGLQPQIDQSGLGRIELHLVRSVAKVCGRDVQRPGVRPQSHDLVVAQLESGGGALGRLTVPLQPLGQHLDAAAPAIDGDAPKPLALSQGQIDRSGRRQGQTQRRNHHVHQCGCPERFETETERLLFAGVGRRHAAQLHRFGIELGVAG